VKEIRVLEGGIYKVTRSAVNERISEDESVNSRSETRRLSKKVEDKKGFLERDVRWRVAERGGTKEVNCVGKLRKWGSLMVIREKRGVPLVIKF